MNKESIIQAIERIVHVYRIWAIGVTDDTRKTWEDIGKPNSWFTWEADSEQDATEVKAHFLAKGINPSEKEDKGRIVCLFLIP